MIYNDIRSFLSSKYSEYFITINDITKCANPNLYIKSATKAYNFDNISNDIHKEIQAHSVDAIMVDGDKVTFIEFKTGYRDRISTKNGSINNKCPYELSKDCDEYSKVCSDRRKQEKKLNNKAIHLKTIETYMTFEKMILPLCIELKKGIKLCLTIVIDENGEDEEDAILSRLGKGSIQSAKMSIGQMLKKYIKCKDADGKDYYYDTIEVISFNDFATQFAGKVVHN